MIDNELETRLRRMLAEDAARAPLPGEIPSPSVPAAESHLSSVTDLTAGRAHRRPVVRWVAVAASVAALGTAATVSGLLGSSPKAFADWRSRPQKANPATVAAVSRACRHGDTTKELRVVAVDLRGDGAYVVMSDTKRWADCLVTRRHSPPGSWRDDNGWLEVGTAPADQAPAPLTIASAKDPEGGPARPSGRRAAWVSGLVSDSVTRVQIGTSRGEVEATVENGVFAAWWPGNDGDTAMVRAYDRTGALVAQADQLSCGDSAGRRTPRIQVPGHPAVGGCTLPG